MDLYEEVVPATLDAERLREHALWFIDANLPAATLAWLLDQAGEIPIAVDAISVPKSRKLRDLLPRIGILFANLAQAAEINGMAAGDAAQSARALQSMGALAGIVTAGARGIAVWERGEVRSMPALPAITRNVTGAGDALIAGTIYGIAQGRTLFEAAPLGLAAAAITVEAHSTTATHLTAELLIHRISE
jgi:pseudouridine kinase